MVRSVFRLIGRIVSRHPAAVIVFYVLLAALSAWLAARFLEHKTGQNDLVAADLEYNLRYLEFQHEFGDLEFIYVVIRVDDDPERAMAATDALAAGFESLRGAQGGERLIRSVLHRTLPDALRFGLPFAPVEQLRAIDAWLAANEGEIERLGTIADFAGLFAAFARVLDPARLQSAELGSGGAEAIGKRVIAVLEVSLAAVSAVVAGREVPRFEAALEDRFGLTPLERGYFGSRNGKFLLVEIAPEKDMGTVEVIRGPLLAIREVIDDVRLRFPGVRMGLTGRPVLQADEMITTQSDTSKATVYALFGVLALFALFFRRLRRPFFSVLTLGLSLVITFGIVTVTIGYLTLLSIVFTAMLVGLGIDFGIHFVSRYQDELIRDGRVRRAISDTLETTGVSIGTGAVTTAASFFTILFVDFQGLRELGFIAGVGVIVCFVMMVTFLPAFLVLADGWSAKRRKLQPPTPVRMPLIGRVAHRPVLALVVAAAVSALGLLTIEGLPYNANIIELQAQELESVEYEKALLAETEFSTWYCAYIVDSLPALEETLAKLEDGRSRGVFGSTRSVLDWLPASQSSKMELFRGIHERVGGLAFAPPARDVDRDALAGVLDALLDVLDDLASAAISRQEVDAARTLEALASRVEGLVAEVGAAPPARIAALGALQLEWIGDLQAKLGKLRDALAPREFRPADLPSVLRRKYVSTDGKRYLAYVHPNKDIWEEENMDEFIREVRAVDPAVTGTPVQVWESSWRMRDGFLLAALYSLAVTLLFLLLDLRSLRDTVLAMTPLLVGLLWLLEALPLIGLEFNLANFFTLPILIGCGIDGGVHIVHRFREKRSAEAVLESTCSAVTLSYLTTMVGFGAMSFAMHRGVRSLGQMMVIGLACVLIASVFVLPAVLQLIERRRARG